MKGFRDFVLRGNVVDLAVGVVVGAAFAGLVAAFTTAFLTPLVAAVTGADRGQPAGFSAGGQVFPYGLFLSAVVAFLITVGVVYFLVVVPLNRVMDRFSTEPEVASPTKQCPECLSSIPVAATRCAFCTVEQARG